MNKKDFNSVDAFTKWLFGHLDNKRGANKSEMKRVFQWERYLDWKSLTDQEKLNAKRILLVPIIAIPLLTIIRIYKPIIITGLIIWLLYRWFEKRKR